MIIQLSNVSKRFIIQSQRSRSFQEAVVTAFQRRPDRWDKEFWALHDVSFAVERGESLGLIGANGSGKSTALKLISRIVEPTSGTIAVHGRVAALLELGAGFHPDLTGRENIDLNGSILGLSRAYIRRQFDEIVAFSELERFIDVPIRNYSSGMLMRLGFAVATAFQPDILLIDEVLAVGDQAFQDRCLRRIAEIQYHGATIILVTHDLGSVQRLCHRTLWLDHGRVQADGPSQTITSRYLTRLWEEESAKEEAAEKTAEANNSSEKVESGITARWGSGEVRVEKAELLDAAGRPSRVFQTGDHFVVRMWYHAAQSVERPAFGISLYDEQGLRLNGPNTIWSGLPIAGVHGHGCVDYAVQALPLLPGRYDLTVAIYDQYVAHPYDHWHRMLTFSVVPGTHERQDGSVYIPGNWVHHPEGRE